MPNDTTERMSINNKNNNQIIILNLRESFGNDDQNREAADICIIQQILYAIDASEVVGNIKKVTRIENYNPQGQSPRDIIVCLKSGEDQKAAIQNAHKLKNFPEWKEVSINPYFENKQPIGNNKKHKDDEIDELKQKLEQMQIQMAFLMQKEEGNKVFPHQTNNNQFQQSEGFLPSQQQFSFNSIPPKMPSQHNNGYHLSNNIEQSFANFQSNQMPIINQNIPCDMMTLFHMYQKFIASSDPATFPSISHTQKPTENETSEYEESSSDESEGEPEQILNELYKSISEKHFGEKKILNILVLGEKGVGKSTWINAIANYMSFDTLEDALNATQPICLIPSKFTFFEKNKVKTEIKLEPSQWKKDENEIFSDNGITTTQEPKTYQFVTSKYTINIIDTPGIVDAGGFEKDKENIQKIVNALQQYQELHAICFLFKANETQTTLSFQYCISELLLQFHKNATENIFFFCTNSRRTFYKPGDTIISLGEVLTHLKYERNIQISLASAKTYCIDNEAFRLICAYFNGVQINEKNFKNFDESWNRSAAETNRFFEAVAKHRPHHVADTLSINEVRKITLLLPKLLADLNELIETNIKVLNDQQKDLQDIDNTLADLKKKLMVTEIGIEAVPLAHPKTVCTASKCIETKKLPNIDQFQVFYKQICHERCYCSDSIAPEIVPDPGLIRCLSMTGENCRFCGCRWSMHMRIRFEQITTSAEVENKNVKALIKQNENDALLKAKLIQNSKNIIEELQSEKQKTANTSFYLGSFLQVNSILHYNDAFEKYVEQKIKKAFSHDRSNMENFKNLLAKFRQEKTVLSEAAINLSATRTTEIKSEDIDAIAAELFDLKHTGKTLKSIYNATKLGTAKNITVKYVPHRCFEYGKYKNQTDKKQEPVIVDRIKRNQKK